MKVWRMLWIKLLSTVGMAAPPGMERAHRAEDARAEALLEHHRRALALLQHELELYRLERQGDTRQ